MEEEMIGDTFDLTQADLESWKTKRVFSPEEVYAFIGWVERALVSGEQERLAAFEEGYAMAKEELIEEAQDDAYDRGYEAGEHEGYARGYEAGEHEGYRRGYFEGKKGYPSE